MSREYAYLIDWFIREERQRDNLSEELGAAVIKVNNENVPGRLTTKPRLYLGGFRNRYCLCESFTTGDLELPVMVTVVEIDLCTYLRQVHASGE